jgi:hypothetical protein
LCRENERKNPSLITPKRKADTQLKEIKYSPPLPYSVSPCGLMENNAKVIAERRPNKRCRYTNRWKMKKCDVLPHYVLPCMSFIIYLQPVSE